MACSKLFSGDLPEISIYIVQNLRNDFNTLYSLALVNRFWCRLAIPLLWEDPFSVKYRGSLSSHFLNIYILFLNDNDKIKVNAIKPYESNSNLHEPLFNYPSLIKTIKFFRIQLHVTNWLNPNSRNNAPISSLTCLHYGPIESMNNGNHVNRKLKVFYTVLFNLFMENNASLDNLYATNYYLLDHFCDMVLNHPNFVSGIKTFSFRYHLCYPQCNLKSIQTLLTLQSLSPSIKKISFTSYRTEFNKYFTNIIQSQSQLSSVKFIFPKKCFEVHLLNSLKNSSNTLISINFYYCQFSKTMRFDALSHLTQLESLQFRFCRGLNSNVIQPLLNITTPLKIKTLVIINHGFTSLIDELTPIQSLIQKIGSYVENLVLSAHKNELSTKFFDTIIEYCEFIKFLHLDNIDFMEISQLPKMILKLNNCLKYLILEVKFKTENEGNLKLSSMILNELSKSLPLSLLYLDLSLVIDPDDLKTAFENCKHVELKKLLIRNWSLNNVGNTLKVIKNFVKEKNLEFLAYYINYLPTKNDVRYELLENLVKETQSFIKMVKYDDLIIRVSEIDGNLSHS